MQSFRGLYYFFMLIGSVCTGYGGLDLAVRRVFGGELAWVADNDPAAGRLLAWRYPDVPNLGDITGVDWRAIRRVDVLTAGFPCQPLSVAGRKQGEADERWLWPEVERAVRVLRPRVVVLENVSAIVVRGLGAVLRGLAGCGYVGSYRCVPADAAGAPHRRERWFGVAADPDRAGLERHPRTERADGVAAPDGDDARWGVYMDAVTRWGAVLGRPAPAPVVPAGRERCRLNPRFTEWMMGLDDGWVTGVPGLSYAAQLHLLGNGVVPQQAELALRLLPAGC